MMKGALILSSSPAACASGFGRIGLPIQRDGQGGAAADITN